MWFGIDPGLVNIQKNALRSMVSLVFIKRVRLFRGRILKIILFTKQFLNLLHFSNSFHFEKINIPLSPCQVRFRLLIIFFFDENFYFFFDQILVFFFDKKFRFFIIFYYFFDTKFGFFYKIFFDKKIRFFIKFYFF